MPAKSITDVLAAHTPELLKLPGVVGTAEGREGDRPVLLVLASRRTPELIARLPTRIEGYRVVVREVGEVRPLPGR